MFHEEPLDPGRIPPPPADPTCSTAVGQAHCDLRSSVSGLCSSCPSAWRAHPTSPMWHPRLPLGGPFQCHIISGSSLTLSFQIASSLHPHRPYPASLRSSILLNGLFCSILCPPPSPPPPECQLPDGGYPVHLVLAVSWHPEQS